MSGMYKRVVMGTISKVVIYWYKRVYTRSGSSPPVGFLWLNVGAFTALCGHFVLCHELIGLSRTLLEILHS